MCACVYDWMVNDNKLLLKFFIIRKHESRLLYLIWCDFYFQVSSGRSVRAELIEEDGESRYKINDVIGID